MMKGNTSNSRVDKSLDNGSLPIGSYVKMGDRNLFFDCLGTGSPIVVFLPAAGMVGLDYLNLHRKISQHTTSVIYDRAGTGWSDPIKLPRSASQVTDEMRSLLHAIKVSPPYLFVGHSLGGIYARRYAQRYPDEVAGMLVLEPPHEDFLTYTPKLKKRYFLHQGMTMVRALFTYKRSFQLLFEDMLKEWPDSVREPLISYHLRTLSKTFTERKNLNKEIYDELRKGGNMPDIPLIVYTAMGVDRFMSPIMSDAILREINEPFNNIKNSVYTKLANVVPRGEHRILDHAGHTTIHTDCPKEVVEAILQLLEWSHAD